MTHIKCYDLYDLTYDTYTTHIKCYEIEINKAKAWNRKEISPDTR